MPVFNIPLLIEKIISSSGENYFITMNSDRDSFGGSERIDEFCNNFKKSRNLDTVKIETNSFTD